MKIRRWSIPTRFVWGTLDAAVLLAMLLVGNGLTSALMVGYPLLIAGSGLWFRVRFVWFMTALSLLSYGVLLIDFYVWRLRRAADPDGGELRSPCGLHCGDDRAGPERSPTSFSGSGL